MGDCFNSFLEQLRETNLTLGTLCDFAKITQNVHDIHLSLCILNSLIGAKDLHVAVDTIWQRDPSAFSVLPLLVAVRDKQNRPILRTNGKVAPLRELLASPEGILEFLTGTELSKVLQEKRITNLTDYVFGVEAGLDSNARKNRGGFIMQGMVETLLRENGVPFETEVPSSRYPEVARALGEDLKRFDFAITTPLRTHLVEVNFYNAGGSKLNEVARSYSELAPKINAIQAFQFVWITDGVGWKSVKSKLQEAFSFIPSIYNLTTIHAFIASIKGEIDVTS